MNSPDKFTSEWTAISRLLSGKRRPGTMEIISNRADDIIHGMAHGDSRAALIRESAIIVKNYCHGWLAGFEAGKRQPLTREEGE